ncbi:unnamed protein product [Cyclocybe aegerita]|uniref:Wax synthase domain-containing protein n=1 Tax=Cyclocybe aegerita TaxID=1973307 RepID=A0A8S0XTH0_CYCAE|nr:unnamed protein product [Cyclocybe aegerita]
MSWLSELVPEPTSRHALSFRAFTHELLPPILSYYVAAILVLLPHTFAIRLALLPITLWSAFHGATQLHLVAGYVHEERLVYLNQGLLLTFTTLAMRACIWTFRPEPYERPKRSPQHPSAPSSTGTLLLDALDLAFNLRGIGWTWSQGLRLPQERRPVESKLSFLLTTLASFLAHAAVFDILHYVVQSFDPTTIGSPMGGTIFDSSLPPHLRYARSSVITFLGGLCVYTAINVVYHFFTLVAVGFLGSSPSQWPPTFDKPWLSTSLNQLWTARWHQLFRDNFICFGGKPLHLLIGKVGGVIGAFLASGILHDFGLWGMGRGNDFRRVVGFFLMNGVGVMLERAWKMMTGKHVAGFLGWVWTMAWIIGWGNMLLEAWCIRGLVGSMFLPDNWRPSTLLFGPLDIHI